MIDSFENYLKIGKVKRKTPDPEEAKALMQQARDRLDYINIHKLDHKTARFILQDAYEAAREASQSLMSLKGFKPYSHEATIAYVKEHSGLSTEHVSEFDRFRKLRHDSIYKGADITPEEAEEAYRFAKRIVSLIRS